MIGIKEKNSFAAKTLWSNWYLDRITTENFWKNGENNLSYFTQSLEEHREMIQLLLDLF